MNASLETIELRRCRECEACYLPSDGPCPRCGSAEYDRCDTPALGKVLAATELVHPATGWSSPHRLALVELAEAVRLLAIVEVGLPAVGTVVAVRRDGDVYRARTEPSVDPEGERGEGESPRDRASDPSFEPPR